MSKIKSFLHNKVVLVAAYATAAANVVAALSGVLPARWAALVGTAGVALAAAERVLTQVESVTGK